MPDLIPLLPADRVREVLLPWGRPGLGMDRRAEALAADDARAAFDRATEGLRFSPRRRAHLLAAVYCWHDAWDEAHGVVQTLDGDPDADLVHAILHRREGDEANARYWINRLGRHPVHVRLMPVVAAEKLPRLIRDGRVDPLALLAAVLRPPEGRVEALERIQAAELLAFIDHCCDRPLA